VPRTSPAISMMSKVYRERAWAQVANQGERQPQSDPEPQRGQAREQGNCQRRGKGGPRQYGAGPTIVVSTGAGPPGKSEIPPANPLSARTKMDSGSARSHPASARRTRGPGIAHSARAPSNSARSRSGAARGWAASPCQKFRTYGRARRAGANGTAARRCARRGLPPGFGNSASSRTATRPPARKSRLGRCSRSVGNARGSARARTKKAGALHQPVQQQGPARPEQRSARAFLDQLELENFAHRAGRHREREPDPLGYRVLRSEMGIPLCERSR